MSDGEESPVHTSEVPQEETKDERVDLEEKVRDWLEGVKGCGIIQKGRVVKGLSEGHRVDFWATKDERWGRREYLVKLITGEAERRDVETLKRTKDDIEEAYSGYVGDARPDRVFLISSREFDVDALGVADELNIECYESTERGIRRRIAPGPPTKATSFGPPSGQPHPEFEEHH